MKLMTLKKKYFIPFLTVYYLFMPFVLVRCGGHDVAYDKSEKSDTPSTSTSVNCNGNFFLTADCVDAEKKKPATPSSTDTTTQAAAIKALDKAVEDENTDDDFEEETEEEVL